MQPGVDTYITAEAADAYIAGHYRKSDANRKRWDVLDPEDRAVWLLSACAEMEQLPYQGRKASAAQALAFPRLPLQYGRSLEPPEDIRAAQAELALWLSNDTEQAAREKRRRMREQGVTAFSLGDLSETFGGPAAGTAALSCPKAAALLSKYLSGGYAVC